MSFLTAQMRLLHFSVKILVDYSRGPSVFRQTSAFAQISWPTIPITIFFSCSAKNYLKKKKKKSFLPKHRYIIHSNQKLPKPLRIPSIKLYRVHLGKGYKSQVFLLCNLGWLLFRCKKLTSTS